MKTELREFCADYSEFAAPLLSVLDETFGRMDEAGRVEKLGEILPMLADVQHRLKILVDKLEAQQAYLLIFGPLKSGKSTLMNAISGSYVSEVSSLPAYPCLVYVRDGEEQSFSMTSYGGQCKTFDGNDELQKLVGEKHAELAQQLQKAETAGHEFDPAIDFPEALRRVDIGLPAADLAKSGVVLVDTPGLYTRMKFGYDLMTRDFRDAAACAVFVVKTESLFLEQVFAEFNELLDIFSRVFLVINIDSSKKDLAPDGTLRPSVESEAPQRIVEAFESLSMEAPLRKAFDDGRLKIYPIDLLNAAADRLKADAVVLEEGEKASESNLDGFISDLSDYLNSSDYLTEFKRDSINQGEMLATELRVVASGEPVQRVRTECEVDHAKLAELEKRKGAAECISSINWTSSFFATRRMVESEISTMARDAVVQLRGKLAGTLDLWWDSEDSLLELQDKSIGDKILEEAQCLGEQARETMHRHLDGAFAGAELEAGPRDALQYLGVDLAEVGNRSKVFINAEDAFAIKKFELNVDAIPVRRGFLDYLLFRSSAKIRRKLFGKDGAQEVPSAQKSRRLGQDARDYLSEQVLTFVKNGFAGAIETAVESLAETHIEMLCKTVGSDLTSVSGVLETEMKSLNQEIKDFEHLLSLIKNLTKAVTGFNIELEKLRTEEERLPVATITGMNIALDLDELSNDEENATEGIAEARPDVYSQDQL